MNKKIIMIHLVASILFCLLGLHYYVSLEHDVYFWDILRSWRLYFQYGARLTEQPETFLTAVGASVYADEYNPISSVLLLPFYFLFPQGESRWVFVSAIAIGYLLPVAWLLAHLVQQHGSPSQSVSQSVSQSIITSRQDNAAFWFCFWVGMTFVGFWKPIVRGYTDIAGMIPILFVLYYVFKHDFAQKFRWQSAFILGLALWSAFLLRRWYAYTIVAMYAVLPFLSLYCANRVLPLAERFKNIIANYGLAGLISFACVFVFQQYLFQDIIHSNYREAYSAYRFSFALNWEQLWAYLGYGWTSVGLIAWCVAMWRLPSARQLLTATALIGVLSYVGFYRSASPDIHHFIPMATWLCLPILLCVVYLAQNIPYRYVCVLVLFLMSNIHALSPKQYAFDTSFLPRPTPPLHFEKYQNYVVMVDYLRNLVEHKEKTFSVISASLKLNSSMVAYMGRQYRLEQYLVGNPDIDLRDGLAVQSLLSDYVVITEPAGVYLPSGQDNIRVISELMTQKQGIGKHYRELKRFDLGKNQVAVVYEKMGAFSREDVVDYLDRMVAIYPQWQAVYHHDKTINRLLQ